MEEGLFEDSCRRIPCTNYAGQRLDRALGTLFPKESLRTRRRMIEDGLVSVNGKRVAPGFKLTSKDILILAPQKPRGTLDAYPDPPRLLRAEQGVFFFYKPSKLHTVHLSGSNAPSLEARIADLAHDFLGQGGAVPLLVQRLDFATSGLVLGLDAEKNALFRAAEEEGSLSKCYFAVLQGRLEKELVCKEPLLTDSRKKTRIGKGEADPSRWTRAFPLYSSPVAALPPWLNLPSSPAFFGEITLAGCIIARGARHQIRAHLAKKGHPLCGDGLYGNCLGKDSFLLHQAALRFGEYAHAVFPPWISPSHPSFLDEWLKSWCLF